MNPTITGLAIRDEVEAWRAGGFTVADDDTVRIGQVLIRLEGREGGKRIRSWSWDGLGGDGPIDGLPTETAPVLDAAPGATHPNGTTIVDHVVVTSPSIDRTIAAFEARDLNVRRVRHTDQYGPPFRQVFFRAGEVIIELIGPDEPTEPGPARLYGLAFTVTDLDATTTLLGEHIGRVEGRGATGPEDRDPAHQGARHLRADRVHDPGAGLDVAPVQTSRPQETRHRSRA